MEHHQGDLPAALWSRLPLIPQGVLLGLYARRVIRRSEQPRGGTRVSTCRACRRRQSGSIGGVGGSEDIPVRVNQHRSQKHRFVG